MMHPNLRKIITMPKAAGSVYEICVDLEITGEETNKSFFQIRVGVPPLSSVHAHEIYHPHWQTLVRHISPHIFNVALDQTHL